MADGTYVGADRPQVFKDDVFYVVSLVCLVCLPYAVIYGDSRVGRARIFALRPTFGHSSGNGKDVARPTAPLRAKQNLQGPPIKCSPSFNPTAGFKFKKTAPHGAIFS